MANNPLILLKEGSEIRLTPVDDMFDIIITTSDYNILFSKGDGVIKRISATSFNIVYSYNYNKLLYPVYNGIPIRKIEWAVEPR